MMPATWVPWPSALSSTVELATKDLICSARPSNSFMIVVLAWVSSGLVWYSYRVSVVHSSVDNIGAGALTGSRVVHVLGFTLGS